MSYIKTLQLSFPCYCALNTYLLLSPAGSIGTPQSVKASDIVVQLLHHEGGGVLCQPNPFPLELLIVIS